jgi:hypothetical protein
VLIKRPLENLHEIFGLEILNMAKTLVAISERKGLEKIVLWHAEPLHGNKKNREGTVVLLLEYPNAG